MSRFQVIVGNIGTVEDGNLHECLKAYGEYVKQSKAGYGRASYEPVTLMKDGEPWREHTPRCFWIVDEGGFDGPYDRAYADEKCGEDSYVIAGPDGKTARDEFLKMVRTGEA